MPSISRAIFHHVAQLVGPDPGSGVSIREQTTPGHFPVTSLELPHFRPGIASLVHTHPSHAGRRRPKVTAENPGG
jgi:hypothetical protein